MGALEIHRLTPARRDDFLHFFDHDAFPDNPRWQRCYCHWLHADHAVVDWPNSTAEHNRAASSRMIERGEMTGYLAYREGRVIGWCNVAPYNAYAALAGETEPDAAESGAIVCFVVAPDARRQGVARVLLDAACAGLREAGLKIAMAKPLREAQGAAAHHFGPLAMYLAAGFTIHRETTDGDVYVRKRLE
jgi:GNAT superfamily N-acetyltransferase